MKRTLFGVAFSLLGALAFAQNYYEIPYVGTRSRLTKLTAAEEDSFVKENAVRRIYDVPEYDDLKRGGERRSSFFTEEEGGILGTIDIFAELANIYKEEIPDEKGNCRLTVYRAMYDFKETTMFNLNSDDSAKRKCLGQVIYVPSNGKYVQYEKQVYYGNEIYRLANSTWGVQASNVQFRICGNTIFAFYVEMVHESHIHGYDEDATYSSDRYTENKICRTELGNIMDKTQICEVEADFPLIDKDNPFRYSVQNAYDGDPATSYVEDTENDLFSIRFDFTKHNREYRSLKITGFAIINGYSSSKDLYLKNNRIKRISFGSQADDPMFHSFQDGILDYQEVIPEYSFYALAIDCLEVFKGSEYSDTCLSEVNIRFEDDSLLF